MKLCIVDADMSKHTAQDIKCRAVVYARRSSGEEDSVSISDQIAAAREYCKNKGYPIVAEYSDVESGMTLNRPGFSKLLGLVDLKLVDVIVAKRRDRISRDSIEYFLLRDRVLKPAGARLEFTHDVEVESGPMGEFFEKFLMLMASFEPMVARHRVMQKRRFNASRGLWVGGIPPLGFQSERGLLVPEEDGANIVRFVFNHWLETRSLSAIAEECELRDYRSRRGNRLTVSSLENILRNRTYIGEIKFGREEPDGYVEEWLDGAHEPLIPREVFDKAQALFAEPVRPGPRKSIAFLDGLVVESASGLPMTRTFTVKKGVRYYYYAVHASYKRNSNVKRLDKVKVKSIPMTHLDEAVRDCLCHLADDASLLTSEKESIRLMQEVANGIEEDLSMAMDEHARLSATRSRLAKLRLERPKSKHVKELYAENLKLLGEFDAQIASAARLHTALKAVLAQGTMLCDALKQFKRIATGASIESLTATKTTRDLLRVCVKQITVCEKRIYLDLKGIGESSALSEFDMIEKIAPTGIEPVFSP